MPSRKIFPSEIARLVYGYLSKENVAVAKLFLESSSNLKEYYECYLEGEEFETDYCGLDLVQLLRDYCAVRIIVQSRLKSFTVSKSQLKTLRNGQLHEKAELLLSFLQQPSQSCNQPSHQPVSNNTELLQVEDDVSSSQSPPKTQDSSTSNNSEVSNVDINQKGDDAPAQSEISMDISHNDITPVANSTLDKNEKVVTEENSHDIRSKRTNLKRKTKPVKHVEQNRTIVVPTEETELPDAANEVEDNVDVQCENAVKDINKRTFLRSIEIAGFTPRAKISKSLSCSDLRSEADERKKQKNRPKFFTPCKQSAENLSPEVIEALLKELFKDHELHEKLARSINQAKDGVTAEDELDVAINSIIEKTKSDPVFEEVMQATLSSFDLQNFLKPATQPLTSVEERVQRGSKRSASADAAVRSRGSSSSRSSGRQSRGTGTPSAESLPYPPIHYDPVDCNIITGGLDKDGNCMFMSHPGSIGRNSGLNLDQATAPHSARFRNILPKIGRVSLPNIHPVLVVTPIMPPPPPPVVEVEEIKVVKASGKKKLSDNGPRPARAAKRIANERLKGQSTDGSLAFPKAPAPTPVRTYCDDMPVINFFATPEVAAPPPPAQPSPQATPITQPGSGTVPQSNSRRKSLSTPRRKNHIRALEFATPQKVDGESPKRSMTSPKVRDPPIPARTPPNMRDPPIATRTPVTKKLSEAWDALTGVNCVLGENEPQKACNEVINVSESSSSTVVSESTIVENSVVATSKETKKKSAKSWDSDLRCHVSEFEGDGRDSYGDGKKVKRVKKKVDRKKVKVKKNEIKKPTQKGISVRKGKKVTVSPSKLSATLKRSTFSVSRSSGGASEASTSEESLVTVNNTRMEVLVDMTPAKCDTPKSTLEETPFTKLLRENVDNVNIDISMITTPCFPETPCLDTIPPLLVTPIHETRPTDYSSSSSYYKPELTSPIPCLKSVEVPQETIEDLERSEEHLQDLTTMSGRNIVQSPEKTGSPTLTPITESPEERNDSSIVANEEENLEGEALDSRVTRSKQKINEIFSEGKRILNTVNASGKHMAFLKMQMVAQCDKKLLENIPIVENGIPIPGFREELEAKRKHTAEKLKEIQPSSSRKRSKKPLQRPEKRVKPSAKPVEFEQPLVSSTPNKNILPKMASDDYRKEMPPFVDDGNFPELNITTRKKLFVIRMILQRKEVIEYLDTFSKHSTKSIIFVPCVQKMFGSLYKWLRHPHKHELDASPLLKERIGVYLESFKKIKIGLVPGEGISSSREVSKDDSRVRADQSAVDSSLENKKNDVVAKSTPTKRIKRISGSSSSKKDGGSFGRRSGALLPLKKRRNPAANLKQCDTSAANSSGVPPTPGKSMETPHSLLQNIDVDRFLSQIHGHDSS